MSTQRGKHESVERGSAMVIAVLVMAIMSLLGISYLLMADTENRIAENEKLSAQALYFGEGVVREVKRWFDRPPFGPNGGKNLVQPTPAILDHTLRRIDVDGDGPTGWVSADGSAANPYYKVGIDRDGDGHEDFFEKPYRSGLADMLVGIETGPDIKIDRATGGATATFLDALRDKLSPNWPAGPAGILSRIKTIDVYGPPYLSIAGAWTRYGMGTVKVTVQIVRTVGGADQILAERVVKAVLNETPFPGPFGPLHSCEELNWSGEFTVHWGATSASGPDAAGGDISMPNNWDNKMYKSIPRATPPSAKLDLLYGYDNDANFATMKGNLQGKSIADPWFQFFAGGDAEPWKSAGGFGSPQIVAPIDTDPDHSNLFRQFPSGVNCPEFDYTTWKEIARSGGADVHYFAWDNGTSFRENASGTAAGFESLTDGKTGLLFFDTKDGLAPHNPDSHGVAVNLTPEISISGSSYGVRGFLYMNTLRWTNTGTPGKTITMHWPGEPFQDKNQNGAFDAGEDWINLNYAGGAIAQVSTTDPHDAPKAASADTFGGGVMRNSRGPDITGQKAVVWGLLYVSGDFDAQGTPLYYGSVVTKSGNYGSMAGTPDLFWDTDLKDNWPPPTWELPRVIITRWETDL